MIELGLSLLVAVAVGRLVLWIYDTYEVGVAARKEQDDESA